MPPQNQTYPFSTQKPKSSPSTKVATTTVICSSVRATLSTDSLNREYIRSPSPQPPPRDYLSFELIGIKPPPSPMPETLKRAKAYLSCVDTSTAETSDPLKSPKFFVGIAKEKMEHPSLETSYAHSPKNEVSFNLEPAPKSKRRGWKNAIPSLKSKILCRSKLSKTDVEAMEPLFKD